MRNGVLLLMVLAVLGCDGPAASEGALCRDVAERLCIAPVCTSVTQAFAPRNDCVLQLETHAGCISDDFSWPSPLTRDRVLECRLPLVRVSSSQKVAPGCDNVAESLRACPDLVRFYGGTP